MFVIEVDHVHLTNPVVDFEDFVSRCQKMSFEKNHLVHEILLSILDLVFAHEILPQGEVPPFLVVLEEGNILDEVVQLLLLEEVFQALVKHISFGLVRYGLFRNSHEVIFEVHFN